MITTRLYFAHRRVLHRKLRGRKMSESAEIERLVRKRLLLLSA